MKRGIAVVMLLLAVRSAGGQVRVCGPDVEGPCYPGESVEKTLDEKLGKIMDAVQEFDRQQGREEKYRQEALKRRGSALALSDWAGNAEGLSAAQLDLQVRLSEFMKEVAKAYRLPLQVGDERQVMHGAFAGQTARFDPKVLFGDVYIETVPDPRDPKKRLTFARDYRKKDAAATTYTNGQVIVRAGAFDWRGQRKAGIIASYLYHEGEHFRHLTSGGKPMKLEESEVAAYSAVEALQDSVFKLDDEFKKGNKFEKAENARKIAEDKNEKAVWRQRRGLDRGRLPAPEPDRLMDAFPSDDGWRLLASLGQELQKVRDATAEDQRELRGRLKYEKEVRGDFKWRAWVEWHQKMGLPAPSRTSPVPSAGSSGCGGYGSATLPSPCLPTAKPTPPPSIYKAPPPPVAAAPVRPAPSAEPAQAWSVSGALNGLAAKGCGDPWAMSQEDLDWYWSAILRVDGDRSAPLGLQGCQQRLYESLRAMAAAGNPSRLTQEIFARTAEAARNMTAVPGGDYYPDVPGSQWPDIPTCRYHDWCKKHPLKRER